MPKKYIQNDTERTIFVGGVMIAPGEGRDVDTAFLPPEHQGDTATTAEEPEEPEESEADKNLRAVLSGGVREIEPLLPEFSDETLKRLAELEGESETPRKTLLAAITQLQLQRAADKTGAPT